jgi:hypothetical protein
MPVVAIAAQRLCNRIARPEIQLSFFVSISRHPASAAVSDEDSIAELRLIREEIA